MTPDATLLPVADFFSGGLDEPKEDIFIYRAPVMLGAYIVPNMPNYEERQQININGLYPLFEKGAIDISKLAERVTTFCLYTDIRGWRLIFGSLSQVK